MAYNIPLKTRRSEAIILIAEDDDDQYELTSSALGEFRVTNRLRRVSNGEELLDYLLHHKEYSNLALYPRPDLILLDLNMPKMDGRKALREIRAHHELRCIPVTVLSVSRDEKDITNMYQIGANSYISKPLGYDALAKAMEELLQYWFEVAQIPSTKP